MVFFRHCGDLRRRAGEPDYALIKCLDKGADCLGRVALRVDRYERRLDLRRQRAQRFERLADFKERCRTNVGAACISEIHQQPLAANVAVGQRLAMAAVRAKGPPIRLDGVAPDGGWFRNPGVKPKAMNAPPAASTTTARPANNRGRLCHCRSPKIVHGPTSASPLLCSATKGGTIAKQVRGAEPVTLLPRRKVAARPTWQWQRLSSSKLKLLVCRRVPARCRARCACVSA
jgi:hypothetical protein